MSNLRKNELIAAQKKYIEFLGKVISDNAVYLEVHNMGATEEIINKGILLRDKIQKLENA